MTDTPEPTITVDVDVTNPGQFFACCGLLGLADRLWPGVEGRFSVNPLTLIRRAPDIPRHSLDTSSASLALIPFLQAS